jgi:hypothetical protein
MKSLSTLPLTIGAVVCLLASVSCKNNKPEATTELRKGTYAYDSAFLVKYDTSIIELKDESGSARMLLSAAWQGRVMTSTSTGPEGASYGWINYDLIASGKKKKQFNPVGGEERFWLGPEGGQFSIYFAANDSFSIDKWQVPTFIDTIPYRSQTGNGSQAMFAANGVLKNYAGFTLEIHLERRVRLLRPPETESILGTKIPQGVQTVSYETLNHIENVGPDHKKETGLVSIWLLSMMTPSDSTTVIIPFHPVGGAAGFITSDYFGDIPSDRLTIKDSVLFFKCDGKFRSKIGLPPSIAKPMAASFDASRNILSFIIFPVNETGLYVNSKWEIQKEPYKGDVVNSYNDGPLANGEQLGPFYELESSSAAKELKRGEKMTYTQVTIHFEGDYEGLRELAKKTLGIDLSELNK